MTAPFRIWKKVEQMYRNNKEEMLNKKWTNCIDIVSPKQNIIVMIILVDRNITKQFKRIYILFA